MRNSDLAAACTPGQVTLLLSPQAEEACLFYCVVSRCVSFHHCDKIWAIPDFLGGGVILASTAQVGAGSVLRGCGEVAQPGGVELLASWGREARRGLGQGLVLPPGPGPPGPNLLPSSAPGW